MEIIIIYVRFIRPSNALTVDTMKPIDIVASDQAMSVDPGYCHSCPHKPTDIVTAGTARPSSIKLRTTLSKSTSSSSAFAV